MILIETGYFSIGEECSSPIFFCSSVNEAPHSQAEGICSDPRTPESSKRTVFRQIWLRSRRPLAGELSPVCPVFCRFPGRTLCRGIVRPQRRSPGGRPRWQNRPVERQKAYGARNRWSGGRSDTGAGWIRRTIHPVGDPVRSLETALPCGEGGKLFPSAPF